MSETCLSPDVSGNVNRNMPPRKGVFVLKADGGFEAHAAWRDRIDALYQAVARAVGGHGEIAGRANPIGGGTCVTLNVSGPAGIVTLSLSLTEAVETDWATDQIDIPAAGAVDVGAELEFRLVDAVDAVCFVARIRRELTQKSCVVLESAGGPSDKPPPRGRA